ncbi:MAG TPA: 30S ribosomal protein S7 [Candidatus Deferrimicrobium sp.]|nr:30S ribosomal protein S7 [Candidatus Deferrimicrobium sp.]
MPRRNRPIKREPKLDYKFGDKLVTQFVSSMVRSGKRSTAERCLYSAIDIAEKKSGQSGLDLLHKAVNNVKPVLEVRSRRVGGATYQVPVEVRPDRRTALALRWIKSNAVARSGKTMSEKLAAELLAAASNEGGSIKKKEDTHKMAEANKAFAHFKW